eukprot:s5902_g4.t1
MLGDGKERPPVPSGRGVGPPKKRTSLAGVRGWHPKGEDSGDSSLTERSSEKAPHALGRATRECPLARLGAVMLGASLAANKAKIICQQCLAPGHWTYECKNGSTYQVRASASRQLKQKRFKQAFLEEEAPEVPYNAFLGDDRARFGTRKDTAVGPPEKKPKTEKDAKEKNEKKSKKKKESSSSSSSDSDSSSSSSS